MEQERLKQALDRLIDAQREALDVIAEGLEPDVGNLQEDEQLLEAVMNSLRSGLRMRKRGTDGEPS